MIDVSATMLSDLILWGPTNIRPDVWASQPPGRVGGSAAPGVDEQERKAALALKRDPQYSVQQICQMSGVSRTIYWPYTRETAPTVHSRRQRRRRLRVTGRAAGRARGGDGAVLALSGGV